MNLFQLIKFAGSKSVSDIVSLRPIAIEAAALFEQPTVLLPNMANNVTTVITFISYNYHRLQIYPKRPVKLN